MWLDLIVLALAVARLSRLFVSEDGPGHIFDKLRVWCGILYDFDSGNRVVVRPHPRAWLGDVLNCVYCFGVWASIGVWILYVISPTVALVILTPFALAHAALILLGILDG